jgi:hypothetical protein
VSLNQVELILDIYNGSGALVQAGTAYLTPSSPLTDPADHIYVWQQPVPVSLTPPPGAGEDWLPSVTLYSCDSTNFQQSGWTWNISFEAPGSPAGFNFALDYADGATQYLDDQTPVYSITSMQGYFPEPAGTPELGFVPVNVGGQATEWFPGPGLAPSGDPSGATDRANLQALLNLGVKDVRLQYGLFYTNATVTNTVTPTFIRGAGRWATQINYLGSGDCIRMLNTNYAGDGFWGGGVLDLYINGSGSSAPATGLHIGDGEQYELNVAIQNFSGSGDIGLHLDNSIWWTEKTHGNVWVRNCTSHVVFDVTSPATTVASGSNGGEISTVASWAHPSAGVLDVASIPANMPTSGTLNVAASGSTTAVVTYTGISGNSFTGCAYVSGSATGTVATGGAVTLVTSTNSFGYLDLIIYAYVQAGQDGVVVQNGAYPYHGKLTVKGNVQNQTASVATNALLRITGSMPAGRSVGSNSEIYGCRLDLQAEVPANTSGGTYQPYGIYFGSASNGIIGCTGVIDLSQGGGSFQPCNLVIPASANMSFQGIVVGDGNLSPGNTGDAPVTIGTALYSSAFFSGSNGNAFIRWGDFLAATLSASITIDLTPSSQFAIAGPQRKTWIITQAASGGPYTVTWPKPGSPSLSAPAVYWPAGAAPTMSAGASAVDRYELVTLDGIHWYGSAYQANS